MKLMQLYETSILFIKEVLFTRMECIMIILIQISLANVSTLLNAGQVTSLFGYFINVCGESCLRF